MLIKFAEALLPVTNGMATIDVEANTVKQALELAFTRFPQLYVHLQDQGGKEARKYALILNDTDLVEGSDAGVWRSDLETLEFVSLPSGEVDMVATAIANYAAVAASYSMAVYNVVYAVATILLNVGVQMALSAIIGALVDDVAPADTNMGVANSATYTFDGVKNTSYSGAPICIVYGEHRVGGNILNVYTQSNPPEKIGEATVISNNLLTQIGLCEGEVQSVSDVWINKLPLSYYNSVAPPETRTGQETQSAMLDFNRIEATTSISRKITNPSTALAVPKAAQGTPAPVYGYVDTDRNSIVEGRFVVELTDWYRVEEGGGG